MEDLQRRLEFERDAEVSFGMRIILFIAVFGASTVVHAESLFKFSNVPGVKLKAF